MTDSTIIPFPPGDRENHKASRRMKVTPKRHSESCRHFKTVICEKTRMLECEKCGEVIDPFDFMWKWASNDRNVELERDHLKKEIKRLTVELVELKRTERNTKARLKRLQR